MNGQMTEGMNLIDGQWREGQGSEWTRVSPADGETLWSGRWASPAQTESAIAAARQAFPAWAETSLDERIEICRNFAAIVTERQEELARLIAHETGKPLWEARTEAATVIAKVEHSIESILKRRWSTTYQQEGSL